MGFGWNPFTAVSDAVAGGAHEAQKAVGGLFAQPNLGDPNRADYQLGGNWAQQGQSRAAQVGNRAAPVSPWAQDQRQLAQALWQQANSRNTLAQQQLRQATDRNMSQQQAFASSASPQNAAMASRMAAQGAGRANQAFGGQSAQLALQERMAALQGLGQLSGQARGQDLQSALQQQQLNDQAWQGAMGLGLNAAQSQLGANMGYDSARLGQQRAEASMPSGFDKAFGMGLGALQAYSTLGGGAAAPAQQYGWNNWTRNPREG